MQNHQNASNSQSTSRSFLSNQFDYLFDDAEDKALVDCLARYVITGDQPITTPALWQDVAIYIRYKKRDLWNLDQEQFENAMRAIFIYRVKYIIEHLSKQSIVECLNKFYAQTKSSHPDHIASPLDFFNQKLHAPVDSLFLTQEKLIIDESDLKNFDKLFAYPCWIEFTDAAIDQIIDQILANKLTDEQIDYFLGATDDIKNYNKWLKVTKHILQTTNNPHIFYTAGDTLAIIRRAVPADKKSQKWFNDQLFGIFWPRVGSIWPLQHKELINEGTEAAEILTDSIGWLHTISDIKDRLEGLDNNFEIYDFNTDDADFKAQKSALSRIIQADPANPGKALDLFCTLADTATSPESTKTLRDFAETKLIPFIQTTDLGTKETINLINKAVKHAETYQQTLARERQNLARLIG